MLLLFFECLICLLIWWRGVAMLLVLADWLMEKWEQPRWRGDRMDDRDERRAGGCRGEHRALRLGGIERIRV